MDPRIPVIEAIFFFLCSGLVYAAKDRETALAPLLMALIPIALGGVLAYEANITILMWGWMLVATLLGVRLVLLWLQNSLRSQNGI